MSYRYRFAAGITFYQQHVLGCAKRSGDVRGELIPVGAQWESLPGSPLESCRDEEIHVRIPRQSLSCCRTCPSPACASLVLLKSPSFIPGFLILPFPSPGKEMWDVSARCHRCPAAPLGRVRTVRASRCWEPELGGFWMLVMPFGNSGGWFGCDWCHTAWCRATRCLQLLPRLDQATGVLGETPHQVSLRPDLMEDTGLCHHRGGHPGVSGSAPTQ